jgi:hypothetical protein
VIAPNPVIRRPSQRVMVRRTESKAVLSKLVAVLVACDKIIDAALRTDPKAVSIESGVLWVDGRAIAMVKGNSIITRAVLNLIDPREEAIPLAVFPLRYDPDHIATVAMDLLIRLNEWRVQEAALAASKRGDHVA